MSLFRRVTKLETQMADLTTDVTRLQNDVTALASFVTQVQAYVAAHSGDPTVDTSSLETALSGLEGQISAGTAALTSTSAPATPPVPTQPASSN
jgi:hypothetical protein